MERLVIWIPGKGKGKARPRHDANSDRYLLPKDYRLLKNHVIQYLMALNIPPITQRCIVECFFCNFATSDSDNLTGFYLDCLKDAGIIKGDSSKYVAESRGAFRLIKSSKKAKKKVGTLIKITPCDNIPVLEKELSQGLTSHE